MGSPSWAEAGGASLQHRIIPWALRRGASQKFTDPRALGLPPPLKERRPSPACKSPGAPASCLCFPGHAQTGPGQFHRGSAAEPMAPRVALADPRADDVNACQPGPTGRRRNQRRSPGLCPGGRGSQGTCPWIPREIKERLGSRRGPEDSGSQSTRSEEQRRGCPSRTRGEVQRGSAAPPVQEDKASHGRLPLMRGRPPGHEEKQGEQDSFPAGDTYGSQELQGQGTWPSKQKQVWREKPSPHGCPRSVSLTDWEAICVRDIQPDREACRPSRDRGDRARGRAEQRPEPRPDTARCHRRGPKGRAAQRLPCPERPAFQGPGGLASPLPGFLFKLLPWCNFIAQRSAVKSSG